MKSQKLKIMKKIKKVATFNPQKFEQFSKKDEEKISIIKERPGILKENESLKKID